MYRTDFWTLWEKARVGCFERTASKHVYYQVWNRSPVQVGCMRQVLRTGALGRPRGMGWGGRWEGGSRWGTHVNPWLIHVTIRQKPLQYCKVISLQLIKINGKKMLAPWKKAMTNQDSILKSRDFTLLIKICLVKAMIFPAIMYGCESCIIKKPEHWKIDAFEMWCWRRLLRVPWTARRSNQSILKEINSQYSLEGLKLKLQYFGPLMQRADSLEKTLLLGKIEGRRKRWWQRIKWLNDITDSMVMSLRKLQEMVKDREGHKESDRTQWLNSNNDSFPSFSPPAQVVCFL